MAVPVHLLFVAILRTDVVDGGARSPPLYALCLLNVLVKCIVSLLELSFTDWTFFPKPVAMLPSSALNTVVIAVKSAWHGGK